MIVGTVTGVRFRDTIKSVMENLSSFQGADRCVLVESDYTSRYSDIPCTDYLFRKEFNAYCPGVVKNTGIKKIINEVDVIVFCDADIVISEEAFNNMVKTCSSRNIFLPTISNYTMNHGIFAIETSVLLEAGLFNEYMVGWGYEDTDMLERLKKAGVYVSESNMGPISHLEERSRPRITPPGMAKWNTWEYNRIISDWENGIDNEALSFGYGEPRSKWPKTWMDKENLLI